MKEARALPKALRRLIDQLMMTTSKVRKERDRKKGDEKAQNTSSESKISNNIDPVNI